MNWDISARELNLMDMETYAKHRQQLLTKSVFPDEHYIAMTDGSFIIRKDPLKRMPDKVVKPSGVCVDCGTDVNDTLQGYAPVARHDYDGYPLGWRCYWCDQLKNQAPISSRKSGPTGVTHYVETAVQIVCVLFMLGITVFWIIMNLNG